MLIGMLYEYWLGYCKLYHLQPRSAEDWQKNGLEEIDLFCQQLHGPAALPYACYPEIGLGCRLAPRSSAAEDPWQPEEVLRPDESHCAVPEERVCFPGSFDPVVIFGLVRWSYIFYLILKFIWINLCLKTKIFYAWAYQWIWLICICTGSL